MDVPNHIPSGCLRHVMAVTVVLLMALPALDAGTPVGAAPSPAMPPSRGSGQDDPPAVWEVLHAMNATLEVPPGEARVLRINMTSNRLEPVDWPDPLAGLSATGRAAVASVEPWLRGALAANLRRLGYSSDAFAREVRDCSDARWRDEVAFAVAHTPPEVLAGVPPALLTTNARLLHSQDASLPYADLVERQGEDGNYTTVSYVNATGARWELPRDVYYFYVAHPRVFWEVPATVSGRSLWRKAYYDELTYGGSGTLASALGACDDYVAAIQNATVWLHRQLEFGYGTNYVQPVEIILDRFGSCGEYSIAAAAALKVAMVPARVTIYTASDHQWNEVWLDGGWTFIDASSDVAGQATVREPELIPRIGSINFNDPDNFERSGWKPFMSMTNSFRPDDVDINSIGIRTSGPAYKCGDGNWSSPLVAVPHKYTNTSRVHITVVDGQGDPVEAAWVGVLELAHDPYDVNSFPYALFACANYTNASGQCEVEVGLQGTCYRNHVHSYTVEILSSYGSKQAVIPGDMPVTEEGVDLYYTYTVTGDAPALTHPQWTEMPLPDLPAQVLLDLDIGGSGVQRHSHGEYGGNEVFAFGTTFDHEFPATVDCAVMGADALATLLAGGSPEVVWGEYDVASESVMVPNYPEWEDLYLVLMNTDSYGTTKVVKLACSLGARMFPRLDLRAPAWGVDLSTAAPLPVRGTVRDHCAITGLCATVDGTTWVDIMGVLEAGAFDTALDVTGLASGEYTVGVRAVDAAGVWREENATLFLDADDPAVVITSPRDGEHVAAGDTIRLTATVTDNRAVSSVRARLVGKIWTDAPLPPGGDGLDMLLPTHGETGPMGLQLEATDTSGRATLVQLPIVIDPMPPIIQLRKPDSSKPVLVGPVASVGLTGSIWDDYGVGALLYRIDGGEWVDVSSDLTGEGAFALAVPTAGWADGNRVLELRALDLALHEDYLNVTYDVDKTPPTLDLEGWEEYYDDRVDVLLRGTVTDVHGVASVTVEINGSVPAQVSPDTEGYFEMPLPDGPMAVGAHGLKVSAIDSLGNVVDVALAYYIGDRTEPTILVEEPDEQARLTYGQPFTIDGTASDNVGVVRIEVSAMGRTWVPVESGLRPMVEWSVEVNATDLPLGTVEINVRAFDWQWLSSSMYLTIVLVDRTAPVCIMLPPEKGPIHEAEWGHNIQFHGNATDDVGVTKVCYRVDGGSWVPVQGGVNKTSIWFDVLTAGLVIGMHTLDVRVADAAGNQDVETTTFLVKERPEEGGLPTMAITAIALVAIIIIITVLLLTRRGRRPSGTEPAGDLEPGLLEDAPSTGPSATPAPEVPPPPPPSPPS